ncbi:MraY family glycosyltransferase [Parasediminibacterium sp. JCM 36343]|uniref:MraY family glycosyltransferase n=1 Tax=Parasediminibacterium sp. JCM 36343 TaxID=3374279 RepID=UPI003978BAAD
MGNIIIGVIIAFIISFYAMPIIIKLADQIKLYDHPDERKVHRKPIPSLGGLGIFIGFMMGLLLTVHISAVDKQLQYYYASFLVVFFYGVKDDILKLRPMKKLLGQLIVSIILIFKANLVLTNMYGFMGVTYILESFSYLLTLTTIIVIMNAFNLIDGIDGLAGSLGILTASVFGTFFYLNGDLFYALMGFVLAASLFAFLIYNYSPAKIFMGDTGSMLVGLINAILVIHFVETAAASVYIPKQTSPAMGFGILLVPLLDTLRVFGIRILHGRSPFSPDRNHLHHLLLDRGFNHKQILFTLVSVAILFIVATYFALPLGCTKVILLQIALFFCGVFILTKTKKRPHQQLSVVRKEDFGKKDDAIGVIKNAK